jgi:hypothetical protein
MDDDFDSIWDSITGGANYGPGEQANTPWWTYDSQYDDFEDDWRAVTGGGYTMDEISKNIDVRDLYEATKTDPSILSILGNLVRTGGTGLLDMAKRSFTKSDGSVDWRSVAAAAGGLYGMYQSNQPQQKTGYQGGIPKYEAVREAVQGTYDPNRRPGSGGQRYFSDTQFVAPEGVEGARAAAQEQAAGLGALNLESLARQERSPTAAAVDRAQESAAVQEGRPASEVIEDRPVPQYARGGIAELAKGGSPRYLDGASDGMADKIKANIDGEQEARLSHGEFVIPADVVSHLGNGNSEAGAERLYAMMDRIREARTGTKKQGKQINPDKFLPA